MAEEDKKSNETSEKIDAIPDESQVSSSLPSSNSNSLAKIIGAGALILAGTFIGYRYGLNHPYKTRYDIKSDKEIVTISDSKLQQEAKMPENIVAMLNNSCEMLKYSFEKGKGSDGNLDSKMVEIAYAVLEDVLKKDDMQANMYKARIVVFAYNNGYIPKIIGSLSEDKKYEIGKSLIEQLPDEKKAELIKSFSVAALKYYGQGFMDFLKQAWQDVKETESYQKAEKAVKEKAKDVSEKSMQMLKDYLLGKEGG